MQLLNKTIWLASDWRRFIQAVYVVVLIRYPIKIDGKRRPGSDWAKDVTIRTSRQGRYHVQREGEALSILVPEGEFDPLRLAVLLGTNLRGTSTDNIRTEALFIRALETASQTGFRRRKPKNRYSTDRHFYRED